MLSAYTPNQCCGSGSAWIRISLGSWVQIRIRIKVKVGSGSASKWKAGSVSALKWKGGCIRGSFGGTGESNLEKRSGRIRIRICVKLKGRIRILIRIWIRVKVESGYESASKWKAGSGCGSATLRPICQNYEHNKKILKSLLVNCHPMVRIECPERMPIVHIMRLSLKIMPRRLERDSVTLIEIQFVIKHETRNKYSHSTERD